VNTITCKGRNSHCRHFVCAETIVDLDTVVRRHDGRTGTFLNMIMHTIHAHYTSPGRQDSLHVSHISMQLASSWNIISPVAQKGKPKHRSVSLVTRKEPRVAGIESKSWDICALRVACRVAWWNSDLLYWRLVTFTGRIVHITLLYWRLVNCTGGMLHISLLYWRLVNCTGGMLHMCITLHAFL